MSAPRGSDNIPVTPQYDSLALARDAVRTLWQARRFHAILSVIAILPVTLFALFGQFDAYFLGMKNMSETPGFWRAVLWLFITGFVWGTGLLLFWYRRFLVGPDQMLKISLGDTLQRAGQLVGFILLMMFAAAFAGAITANLVLALLDGIGLVRASNAVASSLIVLFTLLFIFYFGARLSLLFASISLGRDMKLTESWTRSKPVAWAVTGAAALCTLCSIAITVFVKGILALPFHASLGEDAGAAPAILHVLDLVLAPLSYAAPVLVTVIGVRVYRDLVGAPLDNAGLSV